MMIHQNSFSRILLVVVVLILLVASPQQVNSQLNEKVTMELAFTDPEGDISISDRYDINEIWLGSTNEHLVIAVSYYQIMSGFGAAINITLRAGNGDLYLIAAGRWEDGDYLAISEAESLTEDNSIPENNSLYIQYEQRRTYYTDNGTELGLYVDWQDIGARGPIDLVTWTDRPRYEGYDRAPNIDAISFDPSNYDSDRILDFQYIMLNELDFTDNDGTDTTTGTPQSTVEATSRQNEITSSSDEDTSSSPIPSLLIIAAIGFLGMLIYQKTSTSGSKESKSSKTYQRTTGQPPSQVSKSPRQDWIKMKYIAELGREVRMCCYQTARLQETYCYCGRAIPDDLANLFDP